MLRALAGVGGYCLLNCNVGRTEFAVKMKKLSEVKQKSASEAPALHESFL